MVRKKQLHLLVTFPTTAAAFRFECAAQRGGFGGRLIPVPREISAGCGLAWRDEPAQEQALRTLCTEENIPYEQICMLIL